MTRFLPTLLLLSLLFQNVSAQKYFPSKWQDRSRNALIYLPKNYSPSDKLPLVINMHGFTNTASFQFEYSQFHKTADSVKCIVLYPEGIGLRWNSGTFFFVGSDVDDVGYLGDLMDRVAVLYNADLSKVYSMGYSAGGFMSYKLACDLTNRVAAIAPDVASMVFDNLSSCVPARPINISAFNGLSDPITPYNGFPGNFPGIDSIRHFWQIKNGCDVIFKTDTLPDISNDGTFVVRYTYENCNQVEQVYFKVVFGGHVWPGANNVFFDILGKTTKDISMNIEAWKFFKTKSIPPSIQCDAPSALTTTILSADSIQFNWSAVSDASAYKLAIVDDSDRVSFMETSSTTMKLKLNPAINYRWNVASICNSGYHNWNTTRFLNSNPTGIKTNTVQQIAFSPNPCSSYLSLENTISLKGNAALTIYSVTGERVYSESVYNPSLPIDVSSFAKGFYLLKIEDQANQYTTSFIKQ